MKKIEELYSGIKLELLIKGIKNNLENVEEGDLFVCTKDSNNDNHDFVEAAKKKGAIAAIISKDIRIRDIPLIKVPDTNREFPYLCQKFYDYPDKKIKMIGVTGTDGKTSVTKIIQTLIGNDICGYIGTTGRSCAGFSDDNIEKLSTESIYLYLDEFTRYRCRYASIETSSENLLKGTFQATEFDISAYTNITNEDLNIQDTPESYLQSKLMLFNQTKKDGYSILNHDDQYFEQVKKVCNGKVLTYGISADNTLQIINFKLYPDHTDINFKYKDTEYQVNSPLLGDFNVYNLACSILCVLALGFNMETIIKKIPSIKLDGRLEILNTQTPYYIMVDYAHTPSSIIRLLNFVRTLDIKRSIVVIGQAGESDASKRAKVGNAVVENSNYAIFTYEGPKNEDPNSICEDMISELKTKYNNYEVIIDRREAIKKAIEMAEDNDMVLILGKGNESYENLKDGTIYFNDIEEAYNIVANRKIKEENYN